MSGLAHERPPDPDDDWSTCSLVQINAVYRHGTRYPMRREYAKMHSTLLDLQTRYMGSIPPWLQAYTFGYPEESSELLAPAGRLEMEGLGRRARALADQYNLTSKYSREAFVFEHTRVQRTLESATAFADSYFADTAPNVTFMCRPQGQDITLRFFDNCPKYNAWVCKSTNMTIQTKAFEESSRAIAMVGRLRDAGLHLPSGAALTWQELNAIYTACAYDVALFNQSRTWCSLFSTQDLLLLDFYSDLKKFYQCGPGFNISVAIAAPLLSDMLATIKASHLTGYFRFAHAETVLPLACLLGLCLSPSPLTASWTETEINGRHFKVSGLSPFAGNLAFHVYTCGGNARDRGDVRIKVLVNEVEVPLPFCNGYCTVEDLEVHFQTALRFDFKAECEL